MRKTKSSTEPVTQIHTIVQCLWSECTVCNVILPLMGGFWFWSDGANPDRENALWSLSQTSLFAFQVALKETLCPWLHSNFSGISPVNLQWDLKIFLSFLLSTPVWTCFEKSHPSSPAVTQGCLVLYKTFYVWKKSAPAQHDEVGDGRDLVPYLELFCCHVRIYLAHLEFAWHGHITESPNAVLGQLNWTGQTSWAMGVRGAQAQHRTPEVIHPYSFVSPLMFNSFGSEFDPVQLLIQSLPANFRSWIF